MQRLQAGRKKRRANTRKEKAAPLGPLSAVPKIEKYPCCFHKTRDCESAVFLHMTLHVYEESEQVIY